MAYVGIFLLSLFVALLAALQLADYFGATDELAGVLIAVSAFVALAMLALAVATRIARRVSTIDAVAALLAVLSFSPLAFHAGVEPTAGQFAVLTERRAILIELIVPALIAVLMLWGLMRRHWLQRRGENGISRWPWIATALAGFAILNPGGLELLGQELTFQSGQGARDTIRLAALGGLALLAVIVLIESWIRVRMQRGVQPAG